MSTAMIRKPSIISLAVAGLIGLIFTGCVITEEVAYQGSTESIPADKAQAETVLIANIEEAPGSSEIASNIVIPDTSGTYALPRSGADSIRPYLSGQSPLPARTQGVSPGQLHRIYKENDFNPIWFSQRGWLPAAQVLIKTFQGARIDGLVPNDYLPADRGLPGGALNGTQISQIDLELTAGLLRYIRDVKEGRYNTASRIDSAGEMMKGLQAADFAGWLSSLPPQTRFYTAMKQAAGRDLAYLSPAEFATYRVNMERLRWGEPNLPASGRWVLLNVGAAELMAMEDSNVAFGVNVVVGRNTRRTPLRNDRITGLKFSPDWTAPYSIVEKDLVPLALEKGPDFLNQMGLSIYSGNRKVSPFELNFSSINVRNYTWKQESGPQNVLGGVRFNLENSSSIYMHDSPDDSLFELPERAKSSGCIRVGAAEHFAHWLLAGDKPGEFSFQDIVGRMTSGNITHVSLNRDVPVYTIYYNAWPSHDGELVIMPDIYEQNAALRARMGYPSGSASLATSRLGGVTNIGDIF
ncbi:MAG: L,D-transpeptidase family protein [Alphaproteobacteria bacterium]